MVVVLAVESECHETAGMEASMTGFSTRGLANLAGILALAGGLALAAASPARADVVFDFSTLAANGASCTSGDCVLGSASQSFTTSGIRLGANSYVSTGSNSASSSWTDVSQRFGTASTGETGLGVYTSGVDQTSGSTLEISSKEFLLLNNSAAITAGYTLSSLSLSSIQGGEGGAIDVYGATVIGNTLDLTKLTTIATLSNPDTGTALVQTYDFPTNDTTNYIVVTASNTTNGAGNVLIQEEAFKLSSSNHGGAQVPEPSSLLLYGTFALALGFVTWRRRTI